MTVNELLTRLVALIADGKGEIPVFSDGEWEWELSKIEIRKAGKSPSPHSLGDQHPERVVIT